MFKYKLSIIRWLKPNQITHGAYSGYGFECAYGGGPGYVANPQDALAAWQNSPFHNAVILNLGEWAVYDPWKSFGASIYGQYGSLWFGDQSDPNVYVISTQTTEQQTTNTPAMGTQSTQQSTEQSASVQTSTANQQTTELEQTTELQQTTEIGTNEPILFQNKPTNSNSNIVTASVASILLFILAVLTGILFFVFYKRKYACFARVTN